MPGAIQKASNASVTILESCRVAPPPGVEDLSLPLTFFDITYLKYQPKHHVSFYEVQSCSKSNFLETIVPSLKTSLSETLKHFLPISGNLIVPPAENSTTKMPEIRFQQGDSIAVTFAESSGDFSYLTGNQPRDSISFYDFVPAMGMKSSQPTKRFAHESVACPLFALQVTLFPGSGISIGFTFHHAVGDASSFARFMKAWSFVNARNQLIDQEILAANDLLPSYDRSGIRETSGLAYYLWNQTKHHVPKFDQEESAAANNNNSTNVRATYILRKEDIEALRKLVVSKRPKLATAHLSPFAIACSYIWTCLVKSAVEIGEEVDDTEPEYFDITVDMRSRMDPPLPGAYFGNCLAYVLTELTHGALKGEDGFLNGLEALAATIRENVVNSKKDLLGDIREWQSKYKSIMGKRFLCVVGSPKFNFYDADFGWGKPAKLDVLQIDGGGAMSLFGSHVGLEIGLSLPNNKMDAFAAIFSSLLDAAHAHG